MSSRTRDRLKRNEIVDKYVNSVQKEILIELNSINMKVAFFIEAYLAANPTIDTNRILQALGIDKLD